MPIFINIDDRYVLEKLLHELKPKAKPLWGKMTPQQMVEHLVESVEYTNGKYTCECDLPPDEARKLMETNVYSDTEIRRNVILGTLPDHYRFGNLKDAVKQLMAELETFDRYYNEPGITAIHAGFGPMNHQDWLLWHGKHFTHHFKQFGLVTKT